MRGIPAAGAIPCLSGGGFPLTPTGRMGGSRDDPFMEHSLGRRSLAAVAAGLIAGLVATSSATASVDRLSREAGFNARAWTITDPDAAGTRYVGGDFTSFRPWNTGRGVAVTGSTGKVDASFPLVSAWPYAETVIPDGAGGWYISGGISNVGGTSVSRVAHLNADGSLDTTWTPTVSGGQGVWALEKVGDTILIGGDFSSVNGQSRLGLAAIGTDGVLKSWNPTASGVRDLIVHGDTVYFGGGFSTVSGQSRGKGAAVRLGARTNAGGTCLDNWDGTDCLLPFDPLVSGWGPKRLVTDGTHVYIGGSISGFGTGGSAISRNGLGRVDPVTGAPDASWDPQINSVEVEALALDSGTLYVGGQFTSAGGQTRRKAAAFATATGALTAWDPDVTSGNTILDLHVEGDTVYLAGKFEEVGGQGRNHAAAVNAVTGAITPWDPHLCNQSNGVASAAYGVAAAGSRAYILGDFPCAGGRKAMRAAAVDANGLLTNWNPVFGGPVYSMDVEGSTVYAVGNFTRAAGAARTRAAAVTTAGALTGWNPNPGGDRPVKVIATPARVYLGGFFATMGGVTQRGVAAVDPSTGALDTAFNPVIDGHVRAMALIGTRLYFGGAFTNVDGTARDKLAAVAATPGQAGDGELDSGFDAGTFSTSWYIEALAGDHDGSRLFIGGSFAGLQSVSRLFAAAVDAATGVVDASWNPVLSGNNNSYPAVTAFAPTASRVFMGAAGGTVTMNDGSANVTGPFAVNPTTGALDWAGAVGEIRHIAAAPSVLYLAGSFASVGGQSRANTAAVDHNGTVLAAWPQEPATQSPLVVEAIGSSPGRVVAPARGINCGNSCEYSIPTGDTVTLAAVDDGGSDFGEWRGACSGTSPTCTVTLSSARSVSAVFVPGTGGALPNPSPPPSSSPSPTPTPTPTPAPTPEVDGATPAAQAGQAPSAQVAASRTPIAWRVGRARLRAVRPGARTARTRKARTRLAVTERIRLARPGRYTLIYVDAAGKRVPLARGTRIASRKLKKTFYAPVMRVKGPDSLKVSAVLARPRAKAKAITLRVILRNPDGSLEGENIPLR